MIDAEEIAEKAGAYDWVHQAQNIGEIVMVVAKNRDNTYNDIRAGFLRNGWAEAVHWRADEGDSYIFVPMEWFQ